MRDLGLSSGHRPLRQRYDCYRPCRRARLDRARTGLAWLARPAEIRLLRFGTGTDMDSGRFRSLAAALAARTGSGAVIRDVLDGDAYGLHRAICARGSLKSRTFGRCWPDGPKMRASGSFKPVFQGKAAQEVAVRPLPTRRSRRWSAGFSQH